MRKLWIYIKDYKKECILGPLFKLLESLFDLTVPLVTAAMIDRGIGGRDGGQILRYGGVLILLAMIGLACSVVAQYYAAKAAVGFAAKLRHALFSHIETLSFGDIDQIGTSTLITRMTSDINQMQSGVNMALRLFLRSPFIVFGAMIMAFFIDVKAALIFTVAIPGLALVVFGIMGISMPLYRKTQGLLDRVLSSTRENLTGVRVIRAFHREGEEEQEYREDNDRLARAQLFVGRISALTNPVTYVMVNGALVALLWISGLRIQAGSLTQGQTLALINYLSQILVELIKLANTIVLTNKSLACAGRIRGILEVEPAFSSQKTDARHFHGEGGCGVAEGAYSDGEGGCGVAEGAYSDSEDGSGVAEGAFSDGEDDSGLAGGAYSDAGGSDGDARYPKGQVIFEDAALCYAGAKEPSIEGVRLVAEPGQTIGIIGGTGSGKSSLVHLVPRFYDASQGRVLVDGVDVRQQDLHALRQKIGIVMQKAVLFRGTIRENLLWGNEDATEEDLREALEISRAMEFVEKKEQGIESHVAQGGRNLSGGQRQRLTIARALVRKPEILIFDDSTSALDYATDAKLRAGLRKLDYHPTIFMVSQRTSSIRHADQILVLEDGKVIAMGKHEELVENCEVYREIHQFQFQKEGKEGA